MDYVITAQLLQPEHAKPKHIDEMLIQFTDEDNITSDQQRTQEQQDYVSVTLDWGDGNRVAAATRRQKFKGIVKVCLDVWQPQRSLSSAQLETAGVEMAALLEGESHNTESASQQVIEESTDEDAPITIRGSYLANQRPSDILRNTLGVYGNLDHIHIVCKDAVLEELPWELLMIDDRFIALEERIRLFRLQKPPTESTQHEGTMDVEIVNINMSNTPLAIGSRPLDKLRAVDPPDELVVRHERGRNITGAVLQEALHCTPSYTALHFSGHGELVGDSEPALCVSSGQRSSDTPEHYRVAFMRAQHLATYTSNNNEFRQNAKLVVCACCHSAIGRRWTGFGIGLIGSGVSAVVGMQALIHDRPANCFTNTFYSRLNDDNDVISAVAAARRGVAAMADHRFSLEWWIPTLHTTGKNIIFSRKTEGKPKHSDSTPPAGEVQVFQEDQDYRTPLTALQLLRGQHESNLPSAAAEFFNTMTTIASLYRNLGNIEESVLTEEELLTEQVRVLGGDDPAVLRTRRRIAQSRCEMRTEDDLRVALHQECQILDSQQRDSDTDEWELLRTLHNVTSMYRQLRDWKEALRFEVQLFQKRESILGDNHPDSLTSRNLIGVLYGRLGNPQQALEIHQTVYEDREEILGWDHPDTFISRNNIAVALWKLGKYTESLDVEEKLLRDREYILGPDHPHTFKSRKNMAVSYWEVGRYRESLELEEKLLADCRQHLMEDHLETIITANNLAESYRNFGRLDEALVLLEEVLEAHERLVTESDLDVRTTFNDKAATLRELGRFDDALHFHEKAVREPARPNGDYIEEELNYLDEKAVTLRECGRFKEALDIHQEVERRWKKSRIPDHPDLIDTQHNIAIVLRALGRLDEAIQIQKKVVENRRNMLVDDHPKTLQSRHEMAITLRMQGELEEALDIHKSVLHKQEATLGEDHPDAFRSRHQIAIVRSKLGEYTDTE